MSGRDVCVQRPRFLLTQISIPIAVVLRCPFKISSTAVAVYLHRPMQYICSEKPMRWPDKVTALHPLTHRIVFVTAPHCLCHRTALSLLTHRIAFFRSPLIFLSSCHAELVSASVRGDVLEMARCEILKQVQDDICVLTAHRSSLPIEGEI